MFNTISFYRYVPITYPQGLRDFLRITCEDLGILGRILIGEEGINGAVCGTIENIEKFKQVLENNPSLKGLTYREQANKENTYHKLVIRVRKEICVFGEDVDLKNSGIHLEPRDLKKWYDEKEDFVIIDARNDYEYELGKFKDALKMPIKNFREFASAVPEFVEYKNKKVVLYCTGGVRCEKASAYLREQGFEDVYQVNGGIINYVNQFPLDGNWEGGLFVFDDRIVSEVGLPTTQCSHCSKETSAMINCHNLECDVLFVICKECQEKTKNCSETCARSPKQRQVEVSRTQVGKVLNYYTKKEIAHIKLERNVEENQTIFFKGKTTDFSQQAQGIIFEDDTITLKVKNKVRENDKVLM